MRALAPLAVRYAGGTTTAQIEGAPATATTCHLMRPPGGRHVTGPETERQLYHGIFENVKTRAEFLKTKQIYQRILYSVLLHIFSHFSTLCYIKAEYIL